MRIAVVNGSPRPGGNSDLLLRAFCAEAEKLGAVINNYVLNNLDYRGCQGCHACKNGRDHCVLQDDLSEILDDIKTTDLVVMATPVYWGDVTAQFKGMLDRLFSLVKPDFMDRPDKHRLTAGKKLVFILVQGGEADKYDDIFPRYNQFFEFLGFFAETELIRICEVNDRGEMAERPEALAQARETARRMVAP